MAKNQKVRRKPLDLIIGVGDLHGHYPALEKLLEGFRQDLGIFTDYLTLREGVKMVFLGDYIDRGDQGVPIINKLMALGEANPRAVECLAGNHETLALEDLPFVEPALQARFPFSFYDGAGVHAYNGGLFFIREFNQNRVIEGCDDERVTLLNYLNQMKPGGEIGDWIRSLKPYVSTTFKGKRIVFVHAGIPSDISDMAALGKEGAKIRRVLRKISSPDFSESLFMRNNRSQLFWDRTMIEETEGDHLSERLEEDFGIDYLVVGHTPQEGRIRVFGNGKSKLFGIDVGMTPNYGGYEPTALLIRGEGVSSYGVISGETPLIKH